MQAIGYNSDALKDVSLLIYYGSKNAAVAILIGILRNINRSNIKGRARLGINVGCPKGILLVVFYTDSNCREF